MRNKLIKLLNGKKGLILNLDLVIGGTIDPKYKDNKIVIEDSNIKIINDLQIGLKQYNEKN
jgi:hypothetical protein